MAQTIKELLAYIEEVKPNDYSDEIKVRWLNELEGMVQTELLLLPVEGIIRYKWPEDQNAELIVKEPHDKIYEDFIMWKLDQMMGEAERANNSGAIFNDAWSEYSRWIAMNIDPQGGYAERNLYYLTAYQTAVKLGFVGSEEEWIESLRGEQGPQGKGLLIGGRFDTLEELIVAVPKPEKGDAYMVGEFLYIYDNAEWVNCGKLRGEPGRDGVDGTPGQDGFSPTVEITNISGGHRVTITDAEGQHSFNVMDGQGGGGGTGDHRDLTNRDAADQHPISAITGLRDALDKIPEIIEAEEIGFDEKPTDGSGNLLTSGAIKAALDAIPGGGPTQYLKSASVSGNTLNLTKQDDSTISFTPRSGGGGDTWHFIRSVTASTEHIDQNVSYVTDENENVCGFTFDKDADGNTFSYKDIAAVGILKGSQNVSLAFFVGGIINNITLAAFRSDISNTFRAFQWKTETIGAKRFFSGEYCTQYATNAIRLSPNYLANSSGFENPQNFMNNVPDARQVDKISMYTGNTTVYIEGIIYFYGKN